MGKVYEHSSQEGTPVGEGPHVRSTARADVAELCIKMKQEVEARLPEEDTHQIMIHAKKVLSLTEFKQMFYARGDDHFCLAQIYDCPDNTNSILSSVWGKRKDNDPSNPYSKVINFNRLGGRHDSPQGTEMAYGYPHDINRTFFAQFEVLGNMERDLCIKREHWTTASKKEIEDQLYALALVPEKTEDLCAKVICGRKWSEVEDSLVESHLAIGNVIDECEYVDLYINVQIVPANKEAKPTIIRIRYTVSMRRGPDDRGVWNIKASDTASNVISKGIPGDGPEGGTSNYQDSSVVNPAPPQYPPHQQYPPQYPPQSQAPPQYPPQSQAPPQYPPQSQAPPQYPPQSQAPPQYPPQYPPQVLHPLGTFPYYGQNYMIPNPPHL